MKNKIVRRLALLLSVIMLITSTANTSYAFIVTKTDSIVNTFTPLDSATNDLTINKTVEHPLGDTYVIPDNIEFAFTVALGALYANTTVETSAGNVLADGNGTIMVAVKPGTPLSIKGIDDGTSVTVTEQATTLAGFTMAGDVSKTVTMTANGASVDFVNVYTPASVQATNVSVVGEKILSGRPWQDGDSFSFELEQESGGTWTSLGTKTITYDAANADFSKFDFSDIVQALTFDKVGTYKFRMTEVIGSLADVDYDESVNTFAITVTDVDMDGQLEISGVTAAQNTTATEDNGNYTVFVAFNNSFIPAIPDPDDITVPITVNKTVNNTGTATIGSENFEFVLETIGSTEEPIKKRTNTSGNAVFELTFTKDDVGEYTYKLYETDEGATGVTYDPKVYEISVAVEKDDVNNKLLATVKVDGNEVTDVVAAFTNTYSADLPDPDDITVPITVKKTVNNTGVSSIGPGGFEFVLENTVSHNKMIVDTDNSGDAAFNLTFTKDDIGKTYTYSLYETNEGATGVTYDPRVYEVSIAVTKDTASNTLIAAVKLDGTAVTNVVAAFENTYFVAQPTPDDITVPITVNKTVKSTGTGTISPANFEFVLENTDSGSKLTMKTDANGKAVFELPFTAADIDKTYTYELSETKGNVSGVTYDTDVYTITVEIKEDTANNKLLAVLTMNGQSVNEVVADFENTYRATPAVTPSTPQPDSPEPDSADSGDNSKLNFWFMMMIVSGITTVTLLVVERKYAKSKE